MLENDKMGVNHVKCLLLLLFFNYKMEINHTRKMVIWGLTMLKNYEIQELFPGSPCV